MILYIHRKDLRIHDIPGFERIARQGQKSIHVFIIDPELLNPERAEAHSGKHFISYITRLSNEYRQAGRMLHIFYGRPEQIVNELITKLPIQEIITAKDFTPYALKRDALLEQTAERHGVVFTSNMDQTLIHLDDFHEFAGRKEPYKVFTPFYRAWKSYLDLYYQPPWNTALASLNTLDDELQLVSSIPLPFDLDHAVAATDPDLQLDEFVEDGLTNYEQMRDRYAIDGTSRLSGALNTGALSIRNVYCKVMGLPEAEAWRRQLAWRDFYIYQSYFDPSFYTWENRFDLSPLSSKLFSAWSQAETGIPIIDAAMTQLNATGQMPNLLRMVTAMFLTKNLLCPFPLGEAYFRMNLSDYDRAPNRGGWLWSSSLGYDAAPYFRIMNPVTQSSKFDPAGSYIRRWLPQLADLSDKEIHQPRPGAIVDLKASRARAIEVYKGILSSKHE